METIQRYYDRLFLSYYNLGKPGGDPKVFAIIIIAFTQATNLLAILTAVIYLLGLKMLIDNLPMVCVVAITISVIYNFYRYQIRDRTELLLKEKYLIRNYFYIFSICFFIISIWIPLAIIYVFNEIFRVG